MQPPATIIPESGRICGIDRLSCLRCLLTPTRWVASLPRRASVTRKPEKATECHIGKKEINESKHPQKIILDAKLGYSERNSKLFPALKARACVLEGGDLSSSCICKCKTQRRSVFMTLLSYLHGFSLIKINYVLMWSELSST